MATLCDSLKVQSNQIALKVISDCAVSYDKTRIASFCTDIESHGSSTKNTDLKSTLIRNNFFNGQINLSPKTAALLLSV